MNQRLKIWAQYFQSKGSPSNNHRLKEPGQVHTGSVCNPQSCLRAPGKTEHEVEGRAVQPARGSLPISRSSRVCLDSHCPEHLPTNCPPRTHAVGPSQGGEGGEGRLGGERFVTHKNNKSHFPIVQTECRADKLWRKWFVPFK